MNHIVATDRALAAAALYALAEQILHFSDAPVPKHVNLYRHELTVGELLNQADQHGVKVKILDGAASAAIPLASTDQNGIEIMFTLFSSDLSPEARDRYRSYNRVVDSLERRRQDSVLATQPTPPVGILRDHDGTPCTNEAMHAEGGHDV